MLKLRNQGNFDYEYCLYDWYRFRTKTQSRRVSHNRVTSIDNKSMILSFMQLNC